MIWESSQIVLRKSSENQAAQDKKNGFRGPVTFTKIPQIIENHVNKIEIDECLVKQNNAISVLENPIFNMFNKNMTRTYPNRVGGSTHIKSNAGRAGGVYLLEVVVTETPAQPSIDKKAPTAFHRTCSHDPVHGPELASS